MHHKLSENYQAFNITTSIDFCVFCPLNYSCLLCFHNTIIITQRKKTNKHKMTITKLIPCLTALIRSLFMLPVYTNASIRSQFTHLHSVHTTFIGYTIIAQRCIVFNPLLFQGQSAITPWTPLPSTAGLLFNPYYASITLVFCPIDPRYFTSSIQGITTTLPPL